MKWKAILILFLSFISSFPQGSLKIQYVCHVFSVKLLVQLGVSYRKENSVIVLTYSSCSSTQIQKVYFTLMEHNEQNKSF
jgi:hypothetical protein